MNSQYVTTDLFPCFGSEPALDDLLADPIAQLLMSSDKVSRLQVRQLLATVKARSDSR